MTNDNPHKYKAYPPRDFETRMFNMISQVQRDVTKIDKKLDQRSDDIGGLIKYCGNTRLAAVVIGAIQILGFLVVFSIIGSLV